MRLSNVDLGIHTVVIDVKSVDTLQWRSGEAASGRCWFPVLDGSRSAERRALRWKGIYMYIYIYGFWQTPLYTELLSSLCKHNLRTTWDDLYKYHKCLSNTRKMIEAWNWKQCRRQEQAVLRRQCNITLLYFSTTLGHSWHRAAPYLIIFCSLFFVSKWFISFNCKYRK